MKGLLFFVAGLMPIFLIGCSKDELPPLPEVSGQVLDANGKPISKGLIQFASEQHSGMTISSPIDEGSFSLVTLHANSRQTGASEGTYRVTITPGDLGQQGQGQQAPIQPITLKEPVQIPAGGTTSLEIRMPSP